MSAIEVHTQPELDKALKNLKDDDWIICLGGTRDRPLTVSRSASVRASGSASVEASGSASVEAYGSASVEAYGSASVRASGSASVRASGSASVRAYGSASVEASGSASVEAYGSASVEAGKYVSIHKYLGGYSTPKITGGVVIEVPDPSKLDAKDWCDYYNVTVQRGYAFLFKAVDDDLSTSNARRRGIVYAVGGKVECPDWDPAPSCGGGLHVSPRPFMARRYNETASRYVRVKVKLADLVVIDDKAKTPRLSVVCECDLDGEPFADVLPSGEKKPQ